MRFLHPAAIAASLSLLAAAAANAQLTIISVERYHHQTSASSAPVVVGHTFYATAEGFAAETTATVSADAGLLNGTLQALDDEGDFLEYASSQPTHPALLADFPLSAKYSVTVTGPASGTATIAGPGGFLSAVLPVTPRFTISGISGAWSVENGQGVFTFNPTGVTSFTVTTNGYATAGSGGHYGAFFSVGEVSSGYHEIGEVGVGPEEDIVSYNAPVFTFTNGLAANAGDGDDRTYGFTNGSIFELESGFFNVIGLTESDAGVGQQAFIVGNVTSFLLRADTSAIPEPATYVQIFGAVAAVAAVVYRRRKRRCASAG